MRKNRATASARALSPDETVRSISTRAEDDEAPSATSAEAVVAPTGAEQPKVKPKVKIGPTAQTDAEKRNLDCSDGRVRMLREASLTRLVGPAGEGNPGRSRRMSYVNLSASIPPI
jgi:hypothetical protein